MFVSLRNIFFFTCLVFCSKSIGTVIPEVFGASVSSSLHNFEFLMLYLKTKGSVKLLSPPSFSEGNYTSTVNVHMMTRAPRYF